MKYSTVLLRLTIFSLCFMTLAGSGSSQETAPTTDSLMGAAIAIFVDGPYSGSDYFRTEISMADFVRDRNQADIHILTTSQRTGSGGREYTIEFIGQAEFAGLNDTLVLYTQESDTEDIIRSGLVEKIRQGLVRYVARTDQATHLKIDYSRPTRKEAVVDRWNYWVFEVGGNMWANGQKLRSSLSLGTYLSASRVTENTRLKFSLNSHYSRDRYEYTDGEPEYYTSRSRSFWSAAGFGLGDHWSIGASGSLSASTYSNLKFRGRVSPTLEYNYFPYSESTRRQLRFLYELNVAYSDYETETIYDKQNEWLTGQELSIELEMVEPWGRANIGLSGSHYFHDAVKYRLVLDGDLSVRVAEGLSVNVWGRASRIHDQLGLPKGTLSVDDVLLQQRELATNYSYHISCGLSYSFGSIYNNIVNPRFGY